MTVDGKLYSLAAYIAAAPHCVRCRDFNERRRYDPTIGNPGHRCTKCGNPLGTGHVAQSPLAAKIAAAPHKHDDDHSLWTGPCGAGPLGGVTQSMLVRFLSCRERFRLKYVLGLEPHDKWNHRLGYGNMWHVCEEAHAANKDWVPALLGHTIAMFDRYPLQRKEIQKWHYVACVQFPEYIKFWADHPDVRNRTPLMQEQVFDVPYALPSGRTMRLRGKFDSVDLITDDVTGLGGGVYLQENKSKGDVDRTQIERQLTFDLQTMLYLVALIEWQKLDDYGESIRTRQAVETPVLGVKFNVVRRPLSGGKGTIVQGKGTQGSKCPKCKGTGGWPKANTTLCPKCGGKGRINAKPPETDADYYERLRHDYIEADPESYFFRIRAEVSDRDVQVFRHTCLDPLLEQVCDWYDHITGEDEWPCPTGMKAAAHWRTPFGVYSALEDDGATEYDAFLATGSEIGLRRVEELFTELQ